MHIPDGPEALTTEWLTEALRAGGAIRHARVASFSTQPIGEGAGVVGQLARLHLTYDVAERDAPGALIAKFSSPNAEMRAIAERFGMYRREVRFYQEVAQGIGLPTPRCYYSDWAEGGFCVLLLQDMAPAQSGGWDRADLAERAEIAIRAIAKLHAAWWEQPRLAELDWVLRPDLESTWQSMRAAQVVSAGNWELFWQRAGGALPPAMAEISLRVGRCWNDEASRLFTQTPRTLCHFDYHWDNLCFRETEDGMELAILDWQNVTIGRGVYDVAYLMASVQAEPRRRSEMRLLHLYHELLCERGISGYTFAQCLDDYRLCMLLYLGRLIYATVATPEENVPRFCGLMLPRVAAAILDLNAAELLPK